MKRFIELALSCVIVLCSCVHPEEIKPVTEEPIAVNCTIQLDEPADTETDPEIENKEAIEEHDVDQELKPPVEEPVPTGYLNQLSAAEIEEIVQDAFKIWKSFDQRIEYIFTNDQELSMSNLIEIYSRYCRSLDLPEKYTPYSGSAVFSREDFKEFVETYFDFNFDEHFEVYRLEKVRTNYVEEADCFRLSPTPPVPLIIELEEYSIQGDLIKMVISYESVLLEFVEEGEEIKTGLLTVLAHEGGYKFKSFEILDR